MGLNSEIPKRLGGIQMLRIIGSGGYGDVWLGVDGVNTPVAVKVIDRRVLRSDAVSREERAMKLLRDALGVHPNLITLLHVGTEGDLFFYSMELADPQDENSVAPSPEYRPTTLQTLLAPGVPLPIDECVAICDQLLSGIGYLHNQGIIHRDLKPSNVLKIDGVWKLADFGLAAHEHAELTTVGSLGYLAPNGPLGRSGDLYAIGKILYSMLTGMRVSEFPAIATGFSRTQERVRFGRVLKVINKACDHLPENRFDSASEFLRAINQASDLSRIRRRNFALVSSSLIFAIAVAVVMVLQMTREPGIGIGTTLEHVTLEVDYPSIPSAGQINPGIDKIGGEPLRAVVIGDSRWPKSEGGNGHRYLAVLVTPDVSQWCIFDAEAIARDLGGYVVSINSEEENSWIFANIANDKRLWRSYVKPASGRFSDGEFQNDTALQIPEFDDEAQIFYDSYMREEWKQLEKNGRPMLPSTRGPLIGLRYDGQDFHWSDGSKMEYSSWLPVQPYVRPGITAVSFIYGNEESLALSPMWQRVGWGNPKLSVMQNRFVSFIVEIPTRE